MMPNNKNPLDRNFVRSVIQGLLLCQKITEGERSGLNEILPDWLQKEERIKDLEVESKALCAVLGSGNERFEELKRKYKLTRDAIISYLDMGGYRPEGECTHKTAWLRMACGWCNLQDVLNATTEEPVSAG